MNNEGEIFFIGMALGALVAFSIGASIDNKITGATVAKAQQLCSTNEGIAYTETEGWGNRSVICVNGARFNLNRN